MLGFTFRDANYAEKQA